MKNLLWILFSESGTLLNSQAVREIIGCSKWAQGPAWNGVLKRILKGSLNG